MITQCSLLNYQNLRHKLAPRQQEVYDALKELGMATSWQIINKLGYLNPNFVRPRLSDLYKKGLINKGEMIEVNGIKEHMWWVA